MNKLYNISLKCFIVISLFTLILHVSNFSIENIKSIFIVNFSGASFVIVTTLFILNFYVVVARLFLSYKQFNINISYTAAKNALIAGHIGGIVPVFGAAFGQAANLNSSSNIPSSTSAFVYFYERIIMAVSGLLLSGIAAYFAFRDHVSFAISEQYVSLIEYCMALAITLLIIFFKGIRQEERKILRSYLSMRNFSYVSSGMLLSVVSWLLAACSFLACIYFSLRHQNIITTDYRYLFCASVIVSFLASMPFSVSGWGIREFAAVTIFGLLLIPKDISLFSSVSVGVFSLIALLIVATFSYFKKGGLRFKTTKEKTVSLPKAKFVSNVDQKMIYAMGCMVAIFIFFQLHFTLGSLTLNINIADIFAICGFITILLHSSFADKINLHLPHVKKFIYWSAFSFLLAFAVGYYKFGFSSIALFSKFMGFFVLLGYAAVGVRFIKHTGEDGFNILLKLMVTVMASITMFQLVLHVLFELSKENPAMYETSLVGYSGNRNAFALQILCVICLQLAMFKDSARPFYEKSYWFLSLFFATLIFSFSRSGIVTGLVLLLFMRWLNLLTSKDLKAIALQIFLLCCTIFLVEKGSRYLIELIYDTLKNYGGVEVKYSTENFRSLFSNQYSTVASDNTRFYVLKDALKLWSEQPWFGIGLGGFINYSVEHNGAPMTIHNSFLWFLTEFGIIGTLVFVWYGGLVLKYLHKLYIRIKPSVWGVQDKILLNLVVVFLLMSSLHEVFYQRLFWFLIGTALVVYKTKNVKSLSI